jgi:hypothetical protein
MNLLLTLMFMHRKSCVPAAKFIFCLIYALQARQEGLQDGPYSEISLLNADLKSTYEIKILDCRKTAL